MRREGFEMSLDPPKAVMIPNPELNPQGKPNGPMLEPIEEHTVVSRKEYAGGVVQKLTMRKGEMKHYDSGDPEEGWVRIVMDVPARGLIGYMAGEFGNDTHGQRNINHIFKGYQSYKGNIDTCRNGVLIPMASGETSLCSTALLQARGTLFIHRETQVRPGMDIGESPVAGNVGRCLPRRPTVWQCQ